MTADIKAAVERLTKHVEVFQESEPRSRHLDDVTTILADHARLEGIASDHVEELTGLYSDIAESRREVSELREGLKIQDEALQTIINARAGLIDNLDDYDDYACGLRETAREARRRAAALLASSEPAPGEGKGEDQAKRGDVRVRGDKLCRFIEHDDRGEVWEIIGPAPVHEQGEG